MIDPLACIPLAAVLWSLFAAALALGLVALAAVVGGQ